jgi:hypothetical protein
LVDTMVQWTNVSQVDIERKLCPSLRIVIEKIRYGQFDGVIGRAVDWSRKQGRKWCNRYIRYIIVLTKCVEESVLKLG